MVIYRRIFPSYQWKDAWLVNQIVNLPVTIGARAAGFANGVPPEEIHSSDEAIRRWIRNSMYGCSCLVLFVGETTYQSDWVKYELQLAEKYKMGRIIVNLAGMKRKDGSICGRGIDPYTWHGLYRGLLDPNYYEVKSYDWLPMGRHLISGWLSDACERAGYSR